MKKIGIINYGTGNLENIKNVLDHLKVKFKEISSSHEIKNIDKIILPGVGNFGYAIKNISNNKIKNKIEEFKKGGGILFGICLGMQILLSKSKENESINGLNFLKGDAVSLSGSKKVIPNFGWYKLKEKSQGKIFKNLNNKNFYFAHSFHCKFLKKYKVNYINYQNKNIVASVEHKNIFGCQFHPELSGKNGIKIYKNFINL